jgi:predicted PurR-regulated permease PerM
LTLAFGQEFTRNSGITFWFQQIQHLFIKRFHIFRRRFILAAFILLLPLVLELAFSAIIPSRTNQINSISGQVNSDGTNDLKIDNYPLPNEFLYSITGSSSVPYESLFKDYISANTKGF